MRKILLLTILVICACTFAYSQNAPKTDTTKKPHIVKATGTVIDKNNNPLPGVIIKVKGTHTAVTTDQNGQYSISARPGAKIEASSMGYKTTIATVGSDGTADINMDEGTGADGGSFSPNSYWVGASVGYNVNQTNGNSANNIVGGASVSINPITTKSKKWSFGIIGNIGNFVSSQGSANTNTGAGGTTANSDFGTNISKLTQSANGLNVGIAATYTFNPSDTVNAIRLFGSTRYQLNSFQNTGDTTTKSLSQWKNTIGIEYEGVQFKNGGKFHVGLAASIGLFDSGTFQQIFMKQKSSLASLDASIILPLSSQFGFLLEGTYSQYTTPVYLIGIVIRTTQAK